MKIGTLEEETYKRALGPLKYKICVKFMPLKFIKSALIKPTSIRKQSYCLAFETKESKKISPNLPI